MFHPVVDQEVEAIETNNEPYLVAFSSSPPDTADPWSGTTDPLPYNPKNPSFGPFPGITQSYLDPHFRQADIQQFNLNVQHRFGADLFADVAYVGTVSHHLYSTNELNAAVFGPGATEANAQSRRPIFPQYYGTMPSLYSNANANYHSLQAEVQKRLSHSYSVQAAYTWEKSIDQHSGSLIGDEPGPQNPNDLKAERGLSTYNVGQIFVVNGLWNLPELKGKGILTAVAGGWELTDHRRLPHRQSFFRIFGSRQCLARKLPRHSAVRKEQILSEIQTWLGAARTLRRKPNTSIPRRLQNRPWDVRHIGKERLYWPGRSSKRRLYHEETRHPAARDGRVPIQVRLFQRAESDES